MAGNGVNHHHTGESIRIPGRLVIPELIRKDLSVLRKPDFWKYKEQA